MIEVAYTPGQPHRCGPNQYGHWTSHWKETPGTVLKCTECNKTWIAYRPPYRIGGYMGVLWRREGWLEKIKRLKRIGKK